MSGSLDPVLNSGGYNALAIGSIVGISAKVGDLIQVEDSFLAKEGVPTRVIPNAGAIPTSIVSEVKDSSFLPLTPPAAQQARYGAAGISTANTVIKIYGTGTKREIFRQASGEVGFTLIGSYDSSGSAQHASIVVTDNLGNWVTVSGCYMYTSNDDGLTWITKAYNLLTPYYSFLDLKWGANGTLMMVAAASDGSYYLYRSTDLGLSWNQCSNTSGFTSVIYEGGDTWTALRTSTLAALQSTDDGETFISSVTLNLTLTGNPQSVLAEKSGAIYYIISDTTLYAGTSLTAMTSLGTANYGLGVDGLGNAVVVTNISTIKRSVAGGALVDTGAKGSFVTSGVADRYRFPFNGTTWCEKTGATITDVDLIDGTKSWSDWSTQNSAGNKCADSSSTGTSIVALNFNSYVRTTDDFATYSLINFDVAGSNFLNSNIVAGIATDNNGQWVICFEAGGYVLHSVDDGLTWSALDLSGTVGSSTRGVVGGDAAGHFFFINAAGDGYITTNSLVTLTVKTGSANLGCGNPCYYSGTYYWLNYSGTTYYLHRVDSVSGALYTVTLVTNIGSTQGSNLFNSGGDLAIANTIIRGCEGAEGSKPVEAQVGNIYSFVDGEVIAVSGIATYRFELVPNVFMKFNPSYSDNFYTDGIDPNQVTSANEFIKVSQL
jgi:hypothetical protein